MCESCERGIDRRGFLLAGGAASGMPLLARAVEEQRGADEPVLAPRRKQPVRISVVFLYPPEEVVYAGGNEDSWRVHKWFTWPGNQFRPKEQHARFAGKLAEMGRRLGVELEFHREPLWQQAKIEQYIAATKAAKFDAVLVVNFWNTFAKRSYQIATTAAPAAIVYQPVGSNHQLPLKELREASGLFFIHSIENWAELERGLRAVRARKMMAQSRLLRIAGRVKKMSQSTEPNLGTDIVAIPAAEYISLFDSIQPDDAIRQLARQVKQQAAKVIEVSDRYFIDAIRAHCTVGRLMRRYGADAITIECLVLKERKPCISFAINNGELIPCGCENHLEGTLTQMVGRWLWDRAGFMHNPEFDTSENRYFGAHCTCAWKLHGPAGPSERFIVRPFFHQLPKTPALDVQWPRGEPVILAKYHAGRKSISCWSGRVLESPPCPPAGGCATRVLVEIERVDDVCTIYPGPHPILFCGTRGDARALKAFARLCHLEVIGNV